MKRTLLFFGAAGLLISIAAAQNPTLPQEARPGYDAITAPVLRAHEAVLTSDSLEGRETTFPGQKRAAAYIASQFKRIGLRPLGPDGTFFQHFDVIVTRIDPSSSMIVTQAGKSKEFHWGGDFITEAGRDTTLSAPIAFIGHTDADLTDEDRSAMAGHIVFVLLGKRDQQIDTSRAQVTRRIFTPRREPGAAALFMIADDNGPASFDGIARTIRGNGVEKASMRLPAAARPAQGGGSLRVYVSARLADEILRSMGHSLAALRTDARGEAGARPILTDKVTITIRSHILRETKQTENVVGLLEGSDPALKDQIVAFTAHFDHLGKTSAGVIYHGADDDGSGTSMVMNLAEAFAANPLRPKRSLLFMTVAGEEKGLLGSEYYTTHPIIPLDRTMTDLNIDMIGRVDTAHGSKGIERYVYVIGSDKISTELDSVLVATNTQTERLDLDYTYNSESDPNQFYRRSDHYNFAKHGVPIVFFFTGEHEDYHKPTDTADRILYDRMASIGRLVYSTGWHLANMPRMLRKTATESQAN